MKLKIQYCISATLVFISTCSEVPTFTRSNPTDPRSEYYVKDTLYTLPEDLKTLDVYLLNSYPVDPGEEVKKVIGLNWEEDENADKYLVYRTDMFNHTELHGEYDGNSLSVLDTVTTRGNYIYKVYKVVAGIVFFKSWGEISISHFEEAPNQVQELGWYGVEVIPLGNDKVMITNPLYNQRLKTMVHDVLNVSSVIAAKAKKVSNPKTFRINDREFIRVSRYGYSFLNANSYSWSGDYYYPGDFQFGSFDAILVNAYYVLMIDKTESTQKAYLLNRGQGVFTTIEQPNCVTGRFSLHKISDTEILKIASCSETSEMVVEKFNFNTLQWSIQANDLQYVEIDQAIKISETNFLILPQNPSGDEKPLVQIYDYQTNTVNKKLTIEDILSNHVVNHFKTAKGNIVILLSGYKDSYSGYYYVIYDTNAMQFSRPIYSELLLTGFVETVILSDGRVWIPKFDEESLFFKSLIY